MHFLTSKPYCQAPSCVTEAEREFDITPPSRNTFTVSSSTYLTGNSGRVLVAANPNAGFFNLANQRDCVTGAITNNAGPSRDLAAEHIVEQNLVALGWQFILTGTVPATTQAEAEDARGAWASVPEALMGEYGVFRLPWHMWDTSAPPGTHQDPTLSPEREMWDAIGSVRHPEYMVNLQQTLNAFKSRMMRGISGVGTDRWRSSNWDDTSELTGQTRAYEAMSELRNFRAVMNYLNHPAVHTPFVSSLNRIANILGQFDDAVGRNNLNNGMPTYANSLWRAFTYVVLIGRTEGSYTQYRSWLRRMEANWVRERQRVVDGANPISQRRLPGINALLEMIRELLHEYDPTRPSTFSIDTTGLFPDPTVP